MEAPPVSVGVRGSNKCEGLFFVEPFPCCPSLLVISSVAFKVPLCLFWRRAARVALDLPEMVASRQLQLLVRFMRIRRKQGLSFLITGKAFTLS